MDMIEDTASYTGLDLGILLFLGCEFVILLCVMLCNSFRSIWFLIGCYELILNRVIWYKKQLFILY